MTQIRHFVLWGADNDGYWTPDLKNDALCCPLCSCKLSRAIENPGFRLKKRHYDLSATYDGFTVASAKFLALLEAVAPDSFDATELHANLRDGVRHWKLEFKRMLPLDLARARPVFGPRCDRCGRHTHVSGAIDYFVEGDAVPQQGLFRTDLEFGSGFEQGPILLAGVQTAQRLAQAGLKGLTLDPVAA
ncbi:MULTISPECIES: hypothetical protein [unclassified Rhizobacter]|uniref:hypothetical protein n=1 Tax=unclassified Rhizobacter TaxID=2640088 RepID=UPI0006FD499F|nr:MULTISPECIES: hypothetical protein [unclassified Rhizobacter]KQU73431.1 hypothetical protein ASC88_04245 [Rhizobacter sp. Root29]KQV98616.1 hypothetical protein ASC98_08075 [Rhizobacter sp. Root1238]KRB04869.1 hypothetical protein ASE08_13230 [Rhizobacter sp. Root16D2]